MNDPDKQTSQQDLLPGPSDLSDVSFHFSNVEETEIQMKEKQLLARQWNELATNVIMETFGEDQSEGKISKEREDP